MIIGFDTIPFVGHDIDARGINMSQKRIESTIAFSKPTSLKELQSFMRVVNYFKDHLRDHSALYEMVALTTKQKTKALYWTTERHVAFERLQALVNNCPKLYFISTTSYLLSFTPMLRHIAMSKPYTTGWYHRRRAHKVLMRHISWTTNMVIDY